MWRMGSNPILSADKVLKYEIFKRKTKIQKNSLIFNFFLVSLYLKFKNKFIMKKTILTLMMLLMTAVSFGQWGDRWGDTDNPPPPPPVEKCYETYYVPVPTGLGFTILTIIIEVDCP
jgi:hypothetical protein